MNKKLLSVLLLLFFVFSSSCQQKKLVQGMSTDIVWTNPKPYGIIDNLVPLKQKGSDGQNFIMSMGSYPSFNDLPDKEVEKRINQIIKGYIDEEIERFWNEKQSLFDQEILGRNLYLGSYQILFVDSQLCSILFHRSGYRWTESKAMNIDLVEGKLIDTSGWFKQGYDYQKVMKAYCRKDLAKQYEKKYGQKSVVKIDLDYDLDFNITSKGLYVYFNLAFDNADGAWSVFVPFSVFGNNCLLQPSKSLYGYYDCPEGWNYREVGFLIKYPAVLDQKGKENNVTSSAKDESFNLVIQLPIKEATSVSMEIKSQTYYDSEIQPKPINTTNQETTMMIDGSLFEKSREITDQKNAQTNKSMREETFILRTIRDRLDRMEYTITITIQSLPFETEKEWQEQAYKTYFQINQVLSTLEL
jgi:hypothetical protein